VVKSFFVLARAARGAAICGSLSLCFDAGCAGASRARTDCAQSAWAGTCTLRQLTKVEDRALPIPYVVYEAIYSPTLSPESPQYTPPEARIRYGAPGQYEFALQDHLQAQKTVSCQSPVAQGSCVPDGLVLGVVPFDPDQITVAPPEHASGCAAIESASEQDRIEQTRNQGASIADRFLFANDSAALSPEATTLASAVAKQLTLDRSLECVGVVGQSAPGESTEIAEARAHAIKELLISLGVERGRLLTIALTASVFGPRSQTGDADPSSRRVSLSVLLKNIPKGSN
jgi:outer membrane protein OmpA-like peptidoglycan-associated protein